MADARQCYLERLEPVFRETAGRFFTGMPFELHAQRGWNLGESLEAVLEQEIESDFRYGYTQSGPHKGDFSVKFDGRPVKAYLSRGQLKLMVYALLLAQSQLMEKHAGVSGCVLIDDVASELDESNRRRLFDYFRERPTQFVITTTGRSAVEDAIDGTSAVFLVEQGRVT